jgi:hypothetical protein
MLADRESINKQTMNASVKLHFKTDGKALKTPAHRLNGNICAKNLWTTSLAVFSDEHLTQTTRGEIGFHPLTEHRYFSMTASNRWAFQCFISIQMKYQTK